MGVMHRIKVMLGLADDYDEYDEGYYDEEDEDAEYATSRSQSSPSSPYGSDPASVRRISREPDVARAREAAPVLRSVAPADPSASPPQVRIHSVEPKSFSEAQSIADKFKAGQPVIINLAMTDSDLAKRLLDFASGLTYGLGGGLQKVSDKVFMLTPANVDLTAGAAVRSRDGGMFTLE